MPSRLQQLDHQEIVQKYDDKRFNRKGRDKVLLVNKYKPRRLEFLKLLEEVAGI